MKRYWLGIGFLLCSSILLGEDGYRLWLRYDLIDNNSLLQQYRSRIAAIQFMANSPTLSVAKQELLTGLKGLLGKKITEQNNVTNNCVIAGTPATSALVQTVLSSGNFNLGKEGFIITARKINDKSVIIIGAQSDAGVLYGVFQFLRLLQTHQSIEKISIVSVPKIQNRILDHWDNLNRTVERGYAGASIWNWHLLPGYIDKRYIDYARANASIGINGTVLTNVNANARPGNVKMIARHAVHNYQENFCLEANILA